MRPSLFKNRLITYGFISFLFKESSYLTYCSNSFINKKQMGQFYKFWKQKFSEYAISEPKESIENILAHVLRTNQVSSIYKKFSLELSRDEIDQIDRMCHMRLKRMPVQYVIGEWDFRNLTLKMLSPVFIPRPETEILVDIILNDLQNMNKSIRVLEICCGSGAISLALLKSNPFINIIAVDQSSKACELTAINATLHHLEARLTILRSCVSQDNLLEDIQGSFDVIISNPPYVLSDQIASLQPEIVLYEDLAALDGGKDGLNIIKMILRIASRKLVPGGTLYLETDPSHPRLIEKNLDENPTLSLDYAQTYKDMSNKERFVKVRKTIM